jgi:hypothetical protein
MQPDVIFWPRQVHVAAGVVAKPKGRAVQDARPKKVMENGLSTH